LYFIWVLFAGRTSVPESHFHMIEAISALNERRERAL